MKKIITLFLMLTAALPFHAQGFVFQFHGQNLADDETVVITAEEDLFGELSCETNSPANPADGLLLKRLNGLSTMVSSTLQISHNDLDAEVLQWCMGGECTPLGGQTSLTKRFPAEDWVQVQFDAFNIRSEGYLMATLKATMGLETHQVRILFVNGNVDVDGIDALPASRLGEAARYDLCGRRMQGRTSPGLYVVTDGTGSRKIVLK